MKYDPIIAHQRETELRANAAGLWCGKSMWHAAEQMEAMREEIERLTEWARNEVQRANDTGDHVIAERDAQIASLTAERDAMRSVVEAAEAWRDADTDDEDAMLMSILMCAIDAYRASKAGT